MTLIVKNGQKQANNMKDLKEILNESHSALTAPNDLKSLAEERTTYEKELKKCDETLKRFEKEITDLYKHKDEEISKIMFISARFRMEEEKADRLKIQHMIEAIDDIEKEYKKLYE